MKWPWQLIKFGKKDDEKKEAKKPSNPKDSKNPSENHGEIRRSAVKKFAGCEKGMTRDKIAVLTDEDRIELCKMAAEYKSYNEMLEYLRNEKRKEINRTSLWQMLNRTKWKAVVDRLRTEFMQGLMDEPMSCKRIRLRRLEKSFFFAAKKESAKDMIDSVDSAREEMEPKKGDFNLQLNQFNMLTDEELSAMRTQLEEKVRIHNLKNTPKEIANAVIIEGNKGSS